MKEGVSQETGDILTLVIIDINAIMTVRFEMTQKTGRYVYEMVTWQQVLPFWDDDRK